MARSYYSVVLDHAADRVWAHIRSFGDYAWSGVDAAVSLEHGKAGDQVGAVRRIQGGGRDMRQRLLAMSDPDRSYTYEFVGASPFPVRSYCATIRVLPVVEGDKAFVEWSATFDCAEAEQERWSEHFATQGFAVWLASLRATLSV
jgi:Polyketide cyclase / dehydrase and lipid transport